jgi:hypothetical protein
VVLVGWGGVGWGGVGGNRGVRGRDAVGYAGVASVMLRATHLSPASSVGVTNVKQGFCSATSTHEGR